MGTISTNLKIAMAKARIDTLDDLTKALKNQGVHVNSTMVSAWRQLDEKKAAALGEALGVDASFFMPEELK